MAELTNDILERAGVTTEVANMQARRNALVEQSDAQSALQKKQFEVIEKQGEEKSRALDPLRDQYIDKAKGVPDLNVKEEPLPKFERPTMDPNDLQESFGILMATAMIVGAASRAPFYAAAQGLTGAITGFMQQDDRMVKQSMAEFDKNLNVVKENNAQKRREVEAAFKTYANDLQALQAEMQIIAAKYDDPIALATARAKSISEAQKIIEGNINKVDASIVKLEATGANILQKAESDRIRSEDRAQARAEAGARHAEMMDFRREQEERLKGSATARQSSGRFRDTGALRKEYQKQTQPLREDLTKIDRIIALANKSGGFPDIQLRQAITDFQKGARGTNAMIESMKSFGSLDERVAGRFSRFFDGDYTVNQRDEILDLFKSLKKDVVVPSLNERKAEYRYLAEKNKLPVDEVVVDLGALDVGDGAPPLPPKPPITLKITPR